MSAEQPLEVPEHLARGRRRSEDQAIDEAVWLIDLLSRSVGRPDLRDATILDYGCGVRFSQAFLNRGLPIGRYVGIDVARPLIDHLRSSVDDRRFEFHWMDTYNERYNPHGVPLVADAPLPVAGPFDVVCLFSVFTHLAPVDSAALLSVLRGAVGPEGRLFFSIFLDDRSLPEGGLVGKLAARLGQELDPVADFRDLDPSLPLKWAVYSEAHARALIGAAGWEVQSLGPPAPPYIQHHFTCSPA